MASTVNDIKNALSAEIIRTYRNLPSLENRCKELISEVFNLKDENFYLVRLNEIFEEITFDPVSYKTTTRIIDQGHLYPVLPNPGDKITYYASVPSSCACYVLHKSGELRFEPSYFACGYDKRLLVPKLNLCYFDLINIKMLSVQTVRVCGRGRELSNYAILMYFN